MVTYKTNLFLDKNRDHVVAEHQELLGASQCSFVSKFSSIGSLFKQQLHALLETLSSTEPHYIRCVKPNNLLKPAIFENKNVLQQIKCGGIVEAISISYTGYPTRRSFKEFVDRFGILAPEVFDRSFGEVAACQMLLDKMGLKGYQRKVRTYLSCQSLIMLRNSAMSLQAACRGLLALKVYENMRREVASLRIQIDMRMHLARKKYTEIRFSAVSIQAGMQGMAARNELRLRRHTKAIIIIQSHCRKYLAQSLYMKLKKAAVTTQCAWRGKVARRELRKLKMAAKNKLEKQVEELTWRLQLMHEGYLEEAKTQEIAKLQSALQDMQLRFKETKEMLLKERKAHHAMLDKLRTENEKLKARRSMVKYFSICSTF